MHVPVLVYLGLLCPCLHGSPLKYCFSPAALASARAFAFCVLAGGFFAFSSRHDKQLSLHIYRGDLWPYLHGLRGRYVLSPRSLASNRRLRLLSLCTAKFDEGICKHAP